MNDLSTKGEVAPPEGASPGSRRPVRHLEVDPDSGEGQRLDNFLLRHLRGVPKSHLYRLVRSGQVRINGKRCRPDDRLEVGDQVRIPPVVDDRAGADAAAPVPPGRFQTIYEDEALLAVDKPAGVAVHGGSGVAHGVIEQLRAARPEARFLELAHRLDRETSGVLLIGKKRQALVSLHAQLRERTTDKRYRAIVIGRWPLRTKTIQFPLHRYLTPEGERRVRVQDGGQSALTRVTGLRQFSLEGFGEFTLVEAKIETGRTHQIRVHLAHSGFPIVGDEKYGDFALNKRLEKRGIRGMFLHAYMITIHHPVDGHRMRLEAPLPSAFDAFLALATQGTGREPHRNEAPDHAR